MWMEVFLKEQRLWEASNQGGVLKKRDQQALSIIFVVMGDEVLKQLNTKKTIKETWEILCVINLGVEWVKKAKFQVLWREFETLILGKDELVIDFTSKLSSIVN